MKVAHRWRTGIERVLLAPTTVDLTPSRALLPDIAAQGAALANLSDDDLTSGWSTHHDVREALTQCLADELDVLPDDPDLGVFVDWLAVNEDAPTDWPTEPPTGR